MREGHLSDNISLGKRNGSNIARWKLLDFAFNGSHMFMAWMQMPTILQIVEFLGICHRHYLCGNIDVRSDLLVQLWIQEHRIKTGRLSS
jgi:hypothetical protein